ncbi:uncharacterized protein FOMMEDRAFT_75316 [Fomitiporia mediterranea MF3/22]|uniref:uncharacterized protein n=1 Tax=Fomitiporia mediterranea (strain MF3/22) TaxID=694068 RepID=UPI0004409B2B|nr:uncharacterized protein FOMMEDRAFT_75316 [Fomitiporia mediterranea MF3/22]EJD07477.1 hypothetical protein FOMMEDRAFT_75316 [Fomitiporia mediterranea MF3/22]
MLGRRYDDDAVGSAARNKKRSTALSCAECRRLKLRCDRKFPCSACIKRGCSQICPDGSLTTGKGNRFVLANTETLHEKIAELSHRVRSLEDALQVAHSAIHNDRHPLLSDELLKVKNPLEREVIAEPPRTQEEEDTIDAVGSLSISHTGRTNFYGQTANSWYLLQSDHSDGEEHHMLALPVDIPWLSHAFPFSPSLNQAAADDLRSTLLAALPDAPTARELADLYFANASWMYHPVTKEQFDKHIFARVYPYATAESPVDAETDRDSGSFESHRLALLYIVLAVGILVDLKRPSHDTAGVRYFQLSKAALSLDAVLEDPSIPAIQALVIMCHYMFLNDVDSQRWTLMGTVIKLAQSVHRDSTRWKLSPEETKLRRELFWEIYVYDSWQSLTYGRPPSLAMAHIDCKMAHETTKTPSGQVEMSFDAWKHRFSSELLSIVHDQVFGARTPSYATVTELDKRVRAYYIPPSLQVPGFGSAPMYSASGDPPMALTMQRHIILAIKEVTLLYMHRGFFAKAMSDSPVDPLSGKYGHSVLRAHESASFFVKLVKSLWSHYKDLTERNWFLFTHVFSCAIVLGSIPAKCPGMALSRSALRDLDQAYDLFAQLGEKSRTEKVLPVLKRLRDRAHASMDEHQNQTRDTMGGTKRESSQELIPKNEDELTTLGGKTRLVAKKPQSPSSSRGSRSPASSPAVAFNSPMPQTPASPTSPVSPAHLQTSFYGEPSSHMQHQQQFVSPIESSPVSSYQQSPEMALFGMHLPPEHMHAHVQVHTQAQAHLHAQNQAQWQNNQTMTMAYSPVGMQPNTGYGNGSQVGPEVNMSGMMGPGYSQNVVGSSSGQYEMGGYYDMSGMQNVYASPTYGQTGQEMLSPQDVDPLSAWSNLMAQYTNA